MFVVVVFLEVLCVGVFGLAPCECVLLVNANSAESKEIGNYYGALRAIPLVNRVYLDVPEGLYRMRVKDFQTHIYDRVTEVLEERGLDHVCAWIYSVGFPVRIETGTTADLSLHGATFVGGGGMPSAKEVKEGRFVSGLFYGPDPETGQLRTAGSFVSGKGGGIPSMSLGFAGERGNSVEVIKRCLGRGKVSDGMRPEGTVYFLENDNVRSNCREWQFESAQRILKRQGVRSLIVSNSAQMGGGVMGLMSGMASFNAADYGRFQPGAMAETLTSFGADFANAAQTKCTRWIDAGATATAGTVVEPYSIWTKFTAASFFPFYVSGLSIIESFYAAVRCPLQLYFIGDPLAVPWQPRLRLVLVPLQDNPLDGQSAFIARIPSRLPAGVPVRLDVLLDGVLIIQNRKRFDFSIDTALFADGWHELRTVAKVGTDVIWTATDRCWVQFNNHGRSVELSGYGDETSVEIDGLWRAEVIAADGADEIGICCGYEILGAVQGKANEVFMCKPGKMGLGTIMVQGYARWGEQTVYSKPVKLKVQ